MVWCTLDDPSVAGSVFRFSNLIGVSSSKIPCFNSVRDARLCRSTLENLDAQTSLQNGDFEASNDPSGADFGPKIDLSKNVPKGYISIL